jgi:hypothetical protein
MQKYNVIISVTVESFATLEVEANNEMEANRIVEESISKDKFNSPFWLQADEWDTDFNNATDLRVV